jgi:hypothetical protein
MMGLISTKITVSGLKPLLIIELPYSPALKGGVNVNLSTGSTVTPAFRLGRIG